jgi:hypothetical protein
MMFKDCFSGEHLLMTGPHDNEGWAGRGMTTSRSTEVQGPGRYCHPTQVDRRSTFWSVPCTLLLGINCRQALMTREKPRVCRVDNN